MAIKRGTFISMEGGEGVGKGTQKRLLAATLDQLGITYVSVREPGGTVISEKIRALLLDPENVGFSSRAELFLFEAARAQIVDEIVEPTLELGDNVLADRFYDSSTAYQAFGRGLNRGSIAAMNRFAANGVIPDLTVYLDMDPVVALARATKEGADRIERADIEFHQRVREGFLWCAAKEPGRFKIVDATGTPEEVHERVKELVLPILLERR